MLNAILNYRKHKRTVISNITFRITYGKTEIIDKYTYKFRIWLIYYETEFSHYDRGHQITQNIPKCLINYAKKHIKDSTSNRVNKPQRQSTCIGFYCLLPLLSAALVSSHVPLQSITTGRKNFVIQVGGQETESRRFSGTLY